MAGFGPKLPLKLGTEQGYTLISDLKNLSKQNFLMLLLTNPGERIMDNNFGVGVRRLLFENNSSLLRANFEQRLRSQVQEYVPYISVTNVDYSNSNEDGYLLSVKITYFIVPLGELVNVTIEANGNIVSSS
jgi:phage baseplate assembly protein W